MGKEKRGEGGGGEKFFYKKKLMGKDVLFLCCVFVRSEKKLLTLQNVFLYVTGYVQFQNCM